MMHTFEQGPIRPPSEAKSLLIRATRNCPWNKCAFCRTYKQSKFSLRKPEEVMEDVDAVAEIAAELKGLSLQEGEGGQVGERTVTRIFDQGVSYDACHRTVAAWLYYGGKSVFLQDADSLIMNTDDMVSILKHIRKTFPDLERITTYCRSKTAAHKSVEELQALRLAGLNRIHVGMESGFDPLLTLIKKGATAAEHVEGGKKIKEAGISLCHYIIPGLGGKVYSKEHARETARVINAVNPDYVRLRSLQVVSGTPLEEMMDRGEFIPLDDEDVLREIKEFISRLAGIETTLVSDHILNLLEELEGKLPEDKAKLLALIDRYFALSEEERLIFRLGRRKGLYRRLDDVKEKRLYGELKSIVDHYKKAGQGAMDKYLAEIMNRYA